MLDIITFGSATWDIFLQPKNFKVLKSKEFIKGEGICLNAGSKVDILKIEFNSGGGGTNTSATFSKQGLKVGYCGVIGNDEVGEEIIKELKKLKIKLFITREKNKKTDRSIILNTKGKTDRTILVYHEASTLLSEKYIPWERIRNEKPKWFYLAPLSGKSAKVTKKIVNFAKKNKIKIAINPGNSQLSLPKKELKDILKNIDVLFLNQEEASFLTGISYLKEREILKEISKICKGIFVITKGKEGAVVYDKKYIYKVKPWKIKVVDRTGAGDSFASGFLSEFIRSGNVEKSIQLAIANANSCLKKIGAKNGLLKRKENFKKVKVLKIPFFL